MMVSQKGPPNNEYPLTLHFLSSYNAMDQHLEMTQQHL